MDNQERITYQYRTRSDVLMEINRPYQTKDQKYAISIIKKVFNYLDSNHIDDYEDFVYIFKKCEYKTDWIRDLIVGFAKYIYEQKKIHIDWIIGRRLRPLKKSGINLIFNRLFFEYYDDLMIFLATQIKPDFHYILDQFKEKARKNKEKSERNSHSISNHQIKEIQIDSSNGYQDNNFNFEDYDDYDDMMFHMQNA